MQCPVELPKTNFFLFQMNRPIQVKPADSENRGGELAQSKIFKKYIVWERNSSFIALEYLFYNSTWFAYTEVIDVFKNNLHNASKIYTEQSCINEIL